MKSYLFGVSGFGLLFGLMMGLTVSPVAASILTVLTATAVTFLGMDHQRMGRKSLLIPKPWTGYGVGAFSLAVIVSMLCGIYLRTHQILGKSLSTVKQELKEAGLKDNEMKPYLLANMWYGSLAATSSESAEDIAQNENLVGKRIDGILAGILHGVASDDDVLNLDPSRFHGRADEVIKAWELQKSPWPQFAALAKHVPPDQQMRALQAAYDSQTTSSSP